MPPVEFPEWVELVGPTLNSVEFPFEVVFPAGNKVVAFPEPPVISVELPPWMVVLPPLLVELPSTGNVELTHVTPTSSEWSHMLVSHSKEQSLWENI